MPTVRLEAIEVDGERLPPVCMWCGATAAGYADKSFLRLPLLVVIAFLPLLCVMVLSLYEHGIGTCCLFPLLLGLALAGWIITLLGSQHPGRGMTVTSPLCARHRHYWRSRRRWNLLIVFGGLLMSVGGWIAADEIVAPGFRKAMRAQMMGFCALIVALNLLALRTRGIHVKRITESSIILANVHPLFILALAEQRDERRRAILDHSPRAADPRVRSLPPDPIRDGGSPQ